MVRFDNLRERRRELDWTQQKIAEICHITQSYVSAIERGKVKNPDIKIIGNMAKALGLQFTDVVTEEV